MISTIVVNGDETFAGDGGPALAASLDEPTSVAVDASGNVYIADKNNQRVRMVTAAGLISTLAGATGRAFSGFFSGDGGSASAANLAKPTGVSVDAAGNVYIADTNNQRVRQVSGGVIATVPDRATRALQAMAVLTAALLNAPRAVTTDAAGNFVIADTLNQRIRIGNLPVLTFASQAVGVVSAAQSVTLANTGRSSLTVAQISLTGAFTVASGGTCSTAPISLAPGASCTEDLAFLPTSYGPAKGSATLSGTGVVSQTVLLTETGTSSSTTTALASDNLSALIGSRGCSLRP